MLSLPHLVHRFPRRFISFLLAFTLGAGLWLGVASPAKAISWLELLFRGAQIIQISNISDRQEVQIGQQINRQLLRSEFRLYRDRRLTNYVNGIGQRLARTSERPNIPYTFQIVQDNNVNAFATMGGFVYVTTGLMRAADNEAELAGVLGHEIGHVTGKHSLSQMKDMMIAQGIASVAGVDDSQLVGIGVELLLRRPHSRRDEYDADARGLQYMGQAGYAQTGMVSFMRKLIRQSSPPTFLSTHPHPSDRVARLEQGIDPALANGAGLNRNSYYAWTSSLR